MMDVKPAATGRLIERTVVGVFGNKQHGKDTFAGLVDKHVRHTLKQRTKVFALADPLKECAIHLLGMPRSAAIGEGIPREERERLREEWVAYGKTARQWLQWVGTELRDQIDKDLWIDHAIDTVIADDRGTHKFILTDCRFYHEHQNLFLKLTRLCVGFTTVRIHRPGVLVNLDHASESEVASMDDEMFDYVVVNDGGLEQLDMKAKEYVAWLESAIGAEV